MRSIGFDKGFENSVVEKLKQKHFLRLYQVRGEVSVINAETYQKSYEIYNALNITVAEAEAEGIQKDFTDKGVELNNYMGEMKTIYSSLKSQLGITWAEMMPLMVALEMKNNEYITKNFVLLPDEIKTMIGYNELTALGSGSGSQSASGSDK